MKKFTLFIAALFLGGIMYAQNNVSGVVVDGELGTSLPGASIVVKGTNNGVSSDFNGQFSIDAMPGSTLVITYIGYDTAEVTVGDSAELGVIELAPGADVLSGVTVFGTIDLAKDRETPVAASTLTANEIVERVGNLELPQLLNSTPEFIQQCKVLSVMQQ